MIFKSAIGLTIYLKTKNTV